MKKLGILLDSFSGLSKKEYEQMGFEYVNQIVILDGEVFKEGIDGTFKDLQDKILKANDIKTSMPAIGLVVEKFEECKDKYENLIFIPMNKGMSSTYSTAAAASQDFKNIHVVANKFIGHAAIYYAKKAIEMAERGIDIKQIIQYLSDASKHTEAYVIPSAIDQIVKSGRLSGVKKFILQKGHLTPRLYISDEGIVTKGVKRSFSKAIDSSVDKVIESIGGPEKINDFIWEIVHTFGEDEIKLAEKLMNEKGIKEINKVSVSAATGAYNDKGSLGINAYKK